MRRSCETAARSIHARTDGNPFFVRELSRLLADGGVLTEDAAARTGVPSHRAGRRTGSDGRSGRRPPWPAADRRVCRPERRRRPARSCRADLDGQTCLDRLEPLEALGLLGPTPGDPYTFRFAHDLVRESVAGTTPRRRATPLHLHVADALERIDLVVGMHSMYGVSALDLLERAEHLARGLGRAAPAFIDLRAA